MFDGIYRTYYKRRLDCLLLRIKTINNRSYCRVMATTNFTGNGKQQTVEQQYCSEDLTAGLHGHSTFLSVLNIFLSITAFLGNTLILAALRKESSLHPPSKLLLRSLASTDLCVGLILQPLSVIYSMSVVNEQCSICPFIFFTLFFTNFVLGKVSLFTLTAISVDRLLALLLGLRYKQAVTLKRTYVIVITFWVVSTALPTINFWNHHILSWCTVAVVSLCLVISFFSYTKIFLTLRHHQTQIQDQAQQPNQANQLNIARYRKAVSTALWLQLTLVACYLPYGIVMALSLTYDRLPSSVFITRRYTFALVLLNSSLSPILYFWKMDEVRQAVKDTIRQVLCCLSCYFL